MAQWKKIVKTGALPMCLAALFCLAAWARHALDGALQPPPPAPSPVRIVSLAPGITETLYALGMGDAVVGVTRFCAYPPEAREKPRVAGFGEICHEAVVRLRPDLVVLPRDMIQNRKDLENLGLRVLPLETRSLPGMMDAITELGVATGHEKEARAILAAVRNSLEAAKNRAGEGPGPRVLFSVMHSGKGHGGITELYAIGRDGFYSELIRAAGGVNAYAGALPFPRLSREAVIFLDPEVIIDVVSPAGDLEAARREWRSLSSVSAIQNNRLYLFTDDADTVPGPRARQTLEKLSRALYPEPRREGRQ